MYLNNPGQSICTPAYLHICPLNNYLCVLMSKNNLIGLAAAVTIIVSAFLPWLTVESKHLVFTGVHTAGSNFGEPGKLNVLVAAIAGVLFLFKRTWARRLNVFITAFLIAWTFRNMILFARCEMGICPHKEIGLYLSLAGALVAFFCVVIRKKPNVPSQASQ